MRKIVITGFSGFVAGHFLDYLYNENIQCEILGLDRSAPQIDLSKYINKLKIEFSLIDLLDKNSLRRVLADFCPDYCLHLAAFSSVAYSWKNPAESFANNCNIFLNLIDSIRITNKNCRILSVGSSEEYGNVNKEELPLKEEQIVNPLSPYAVARVSQEMLSKIYVKAFDMKIIMTRSFNHIGPRQDDRFVIPSFIKRILDVKQTGSKEGEIETGDISIIRDFVDVRDVVKAYYLLLTDGVPGEIYNICSGNGYQLSDMIEYIANEVGVKITTKINENFVRPDDNKAIIGSADKIESELGWKPEISIKDTLRDMITERLENRGL